MRRVRIASIFLVMVAIIVLMAVIVGFSMTELSISQSRLQDNTEKYIELRDSISSMTEASDYLTEECRSFVVEGGKEHLLNYFNEINSSRRRDKAVARISEYDESDNIRKLLEMSLDKSNELTIKEKYAMKLSASGHHIEDAEVDHYLEGVTLSDEDLKLSDDAAIRKATEIVFDDEYNSYKTSIRQGVYDSLQNLLDTTREAQLESYNRAAKLSRRLNVLFFATIIMTGILLLITAVSLVIPMKRSISYINRNEMLPLDGAYEYAFLADTFNRMLYKNIKHSEFLSYEATHDELTDLYNRKLFEQKRIELADSETALILVDIDYFKEVNDSYGHETGDRILKKVSAAMSRTFRNEDFVCRIGGDEFAVIMVQMTPDLDFVIENKIESLRNAVSEEDGLPEVTLSIGAAFSADAEDPESLFRNADAALYIVKEKGRNGFAFFQE